MTGNVATSALAKTSAGPRDTVVRPGVIGPRFHSRSFFGRGFSLVEVLLVISVTIIGFLAMFHLQTGLIKVNANQWNMSQATYLGKHVLESIQMESLSWYNDNGSGVGGFQQTSFRYLKNAGTPVAGSGSGWLDPNFHSPGEAFRLLNQVGWDQTYDLGILDEVPEDINQRFCVKYRITWIIPNLLIRAEVQVLWPKSDAQAGDYDTCPADMFNHPEDVFSITLPMTVMKNVFVSTI